MASVLIAFSFSTGLNTICTRPFQFEGLFLVVPFFHQALQVTLSNALLFSFFLLPTDLRLFLVLMYPYCLLLLQRVCLLLVRRLPCVARSIAFANSFLIAMPSLLY